MAECQCRFPNGASVRIGDAELSPCQYKLSEKYKNVTVEILTCPKCGATSIGWYRQDNTIDILEGE